MTDKEPPDRVSVTPEQACAVLDHIVDMMAYHSSCPIRRALVFLDIYQNPNTTQSDIRTRQDIGKSVLNRDIDWMFNYGVIRRNESQKDGRKIYVSASEYSSEHVEKALDIFQNSHKSLQNFLKSFINILKDDKASLREAKIVAKIHEKGTIDKQEILNSLYNGSAATESRTLMKLIEEGIIKNVRSSNTGR